MCSIYKKKEGIRSFKQLGIYQNKLNKACFQHDMAYEDCKDLTNRTASDKILRDRVFNIAKNPEYCGCRSGLASMIYKFFKKETLGSHIKNENICEKNKQKNYTNQLLENLLKQ